MITRATRRFFGRLGPGLITGAADDDPSGIATYSQAGAQFGVGMVWSVFLTTPLMVGIQVVSARIGRVTGHGIARNLRDYYPRPLLWSVVSLLAIANTINIAADIGAMGEALRLVIGGSPIVYAFAFGVVAVLFQLLVPYQRLAPVLKWLTLSLFAYVGVVLLVHIPWKELVIATLVPPVELTRDYLLLLVGVLGTTISPYLFFWQASQEVEELRANRGDEPLREHPTHARSHLRRIKIDTWFGMAFSNAIAIAIMVSTAVTLHGAGIHDIQTSAQAAEALKPIAGELAFALFAAGIIGTGLLAVPVLAGSAAYAVSEVLGWKASLSHGFHEARGFYGLIIAATGLGTLLGMLAVDPIQALVWAAVVNGVISVPIMAVMLWLGQSPRIMGDLTISLRHRLLGWSATALMALAVVVMLATL